jgi:NADP-dependent 3-hydroxy acid dehydrogenase YdfG
MWDDERVEMKVRKDKMLTPQEAADAVYYAVNQPQQAALNELTLQPESHQMV